MEARTFPGQEGALDALADLVIVLASGQAPTWLAPHLAGANGLALAKDNGDTRPIAIGETARRLTSRALCATEKGDGFAPTG